VKMSKVWNLPNKFKFLEILGRGCGVCEIWNLAHASSAAVDHDELGEQTWVNMGRRMMTTTSSFGGFGWELQSII